MIYGELGRHPIDIDIKVRFITYWSKLVNGKQSKFSCILYKLSRKLNEQGNIHLSWISYVKKILNECGFPYIWESQNFRSTDWLKCTVKQRLFDQFVQIWHASMFNSPKALNYRIFKTNFEFEEYFSILNIKEAVRLCRFRTTNNYLPIETGRWRNVARENRYCHLCNCEKIGDEYHYILECTSIHDQRKIYLPRYYLKRYNTFKFCELMTSKKQSLLKRLCIFIKHINDCVCAPGLSAD